MIVSRMSPEDARAISEIKPGWTLTLDYGSHTSLKVSEVWRTGIQGHSSQLETPHVVKCIFNLPSLGSLFSNHNFKQDNQHQGWGSLDKVLIAVPFAPRHLIFKRKALSTRAAADALDRLKYFDCMSITRQNLEQVSRRASR